MVLNPPKKIFFSHRKRASNGDKGQIEEPSPLKLSLSLMSYKPSAAGKKDAVICVSIQIG